METQVFAHAAYSFTYACQRSTQNAACPAVLRLLCQFGSSVSLCHSDDQVCCTSIRQIRGFDTKLVEQRVRCTRSVGAAVQSEQGKMTDAEITPSELKFRFQLNKQLPTAISIHNPGGDRLAFKVKTTTPKKYVVRPSSGVVEPRSTASVQVSGFGCSRAAPWL